MSEQRFREVPESERKIPENKHPANQPDEYVKCPYFPEHELRRSRLPYHLMKCQKNPNAPQLVACPFNFMHRVRMEDRAEHIILCEDKIFTRYADRKPASYQRTEKEVLNFKTAAERSRAKDHQTGKELNIIAEDNNEEWWD